MLPFAKLHVDGRVVAVTSGAGIFTSDIWGEIFVQFFISLMVTV